MTLLTTTAWIRWNPVVLSQIPIRRILEEHKADGYLGTASEDRSGPMLKQPRADIGPTQGGHLNNTERMDTLVTISERRAPGGELSPVDYRL